MLINVVENVVETGNIQIVNANGKFGKSFPKNRSFFLVNNTHCDLEDNNTRPLFLKKLKMLSKDDCIEFLGTSTLRFIENSNVCILKKHNIFMEAIINICTI